MPTIDFLFALLPSTAWLMPYIYALVYYCIKPINVYIIYTYFDINFLLFHCIRCAHSIGVVAAAVAIHKLLYKTGYKYHISLSIDNKEPQQKQQQNYIWPDLYLPVISYSISTQLSCTKESISSLFFFASSYLYLI